MSLIDSPSNELKRYSLKKLKSLDCKSKLDIFNNFKYQNGHVGLVYPDSTWFYHNVIGIGNEIEYSTNEKIRFIKHLCEEDLYYFTKFILKKNKLREIPNREMAEKIMIRLDKENQERKLICEPRGIFKTTIASVSFPIWCIVKDPNISIQIDSETDNQAKGIYLNIKEEFESNILLREIWGDYRSNRWNETALYVSKRNIFRRDPTVFHSGVDSSINGLHPDICIIDDPCSEINTQTQDGLDKVYDHYKLMTPLVDKKGQIIVIMTRWNYDDLASRIMKHEKDMFSVISVKSCYNEDGSLYAPDILSYKFLENAKKSMGMYLFSANYLNDPKPDSEKSFKLGWLKYYKTLTEEDNEGNVKNIPVSVYMSIDASWADKTSNTGRDPTAIIINGHTDDGRIYLIHYLNKRLSPTELIDVIFDYYQQYNPIVVDSEDIGTQKGLNHLLEQEMVKRNMFFPLNRVKHQQQTKDNRIMSLIPYFQNGYVYIKEEMTEFVNQMINFNMNHKIDHDDLLDAFEMNISEHRAVSDQNQEFYDKQEEEFLFHADPKTGRM